MYEQKITIDHLKKMHLSKQVFARVLNENFLLPFDFARIKKILSDVFSLQTVESNEVLYLKRKAKVVAQRHRNSFTELYLSNLVHHYVSRSV